MVGLLVSVRTEEMKRIRQQGQYKAKSLKETTSPRPSETLIAAATEIAKASNLPKKKK